MHTLALGAFIGIALYGYVRLVSTLIILYNSED